MDEKVHEQGNGARIRVSTTQPAPEPLPESESYGGPPPLQAGRPAWARQETAAPGVTPGTQGWGVALALGVVALVFCSAIYNAVVLLTHIDFKLLATFSGTAIGYAIRAGGIQGAKTPQRMVACALTYVCLASVYVPWYYDEIVHPELYTWEPVEFELDDEGGRSWDPAFDPVERPTGPVEIASLDAPAPAEPAFGFDVGAAAQAVARAAVFPAIQMGWGDGLAIVWLVFAWAQAWKTSAEGW